MGVTIQQVEKEEANSEQVQVAQFKLSEIEALLQTLRQLITKVTNLKQTQKATTTKLKGACRKCREEGHLQKDCTTATGAENE